jgi:hypothetical protein
MADFKIKSAAGTGNKTLIQGQDQSDSNYAIEIGDSGASTLHNTTITAGTFPAGHVIQTKGTTNATKYTFENDAFTEMHTGNRVTITPTSTSNKLFMQFWIPVSGGGTTAIWNFDLYDVTGSSQVEPKGVTGHTNQCHFTHRGSHADANDMDMLNFGLWANIARTTETIYTIRGQCRDGDTDFYVNYTSNSTADWAATGVTTFVIQEIQQ